MSVLVFELNDAGVTVADESGIRMESPGYAIVEPERTIVGEAAYRAARLSPRWTNNRYWDELSLDPVDKPTAQIRSHADIAYVQLDELRTAVARDETPEAVFAVPGTFDNRQLALVLGIARECSLQTVGLVDAAVAAATQAPADGDLLHVDMLLHLAVVTRIRGGAQLARAGVTEVGKAGIATLRERWVDLIADLFVNQTRFDPLHAAETEQMLYDRLAGWLEELSNAGSTLLEMRSGPKIHRVTLAREAVLERTTVQYGALADQVRSAAADGPFTLLLSHRAAAMPGLAAVLAEAAGAEPVELQPDAAARGALAHLEHIRSEGEAVSFVTALPAPSVARPGHVPDPGKEARPVSAVRAAKAPGASNAAQNVRTVPAPARPTHLLYRSRAWPIGAVACRLGLDAAGLRLGASLNGAEAICSIYARGPRVVLENHGAGEAFVNDRLVEGETQLALGDRVRIGAGAGEVLELIALVNGDGP